MPVGTVIRFDEARGYGFVAPLQGGEDVFVHANDLGDERHLIKPGLRVRYEVAQSERGLKVASIAIEDPAPAPSSLAATRDSDEYDVLSVSEFQSAVTEVLLDNVPTLTGAQIVTARRALLAMAREYGWVDE
jgi:cold shock CspA family protein